MTAPSPKKLHKRSAPSRAGSDFSYSTVYSSSSTLVHEERLCITPDTTRCKPWAIKALNQLSLKCKRSVSFGKGKGKEASDSVAESDDEEPHISPYTRTLDPFVLEIDKAASARVRKLMTEKHEELDLLPECLPQMLRKAPSSVALQTKRTKPPPRQLTELQLASAPDLRLRPKRNSIEAITDPFYLEAVLSKFPKPPVRNPGEYASRAPINPKVRRQNSNFSLPTSKAYPERAKMQARHWIDRPAPKDLPHLREQSWMTRSDSGVSCGL